MSKFRVLKNLLDYPDVRFNGKMKRNSLKLIVFVIILFGAINLFRLVSACDEEEISHIITGNAIGNNTIFEKNLVILSLIKETLIVIVLGLLIIWLIKRIFEIKQINKVKRRKDE